MRSHWWLIGCFVVGAPTFAKAAIDVGVGTVLPVYIGGQVVAELPHRVLVSGEVGWMPGPYVDLINATAKAFNAYDDVTADVIASAIQNSLVLRPSVGWRPFRKSGFEVMGGYTLVLLGGSVSAVEAIEAATGQATGVQGGAQIPMSSSIHAFHLTVGWSWVLDEHWVLRGTVGYLHIFASSTSLDVTSNRAQVQEAYDALEAALDAYLNDIFTSYVKTPTLGLTVNYRF